MDISLSIDPTSDNARIAKILSALADALSDNPEPVDIKPSVVPAAEPKAEPAEEPAQPEIAVKRRRGRPRKAVETVATAEPEAVETEAEETEPEGDAAEPESIEPEVETVETESAVDPAAELFAPRTLEELNEDFRNLARERGLVWARQIMAQYGAKDLQSLSEDALRAILTDVDAQAA